MELSKHLGVNPPTILEYPKEADGSNPDLILGLEIETEKCKLSQGAYTELLNPIWEVITDGSLRGRAFEFVSAPMKQKHMLMAVKDFFDTLKFTEQNYTDRCSIHVHVNCTDLTIDQLSSFALIYSVFEESLFEFVGHDRDTNIYCIPWNQCRWNFKLINNLKTVISAVPRSWQKYTAVNLIPLQTKGTVEFRHMHGTSDVDKIHQWLNLIGCMFKYAKETSFQTVYDIVKNINYVSNYEQFFNQVFGNYWKFSEEIYKKLEEGVISAKYSLINYDPSKDKKPKSKQKIDLAIEGELFRPNNRNPNFDRFMSLANYDNLGSYYDVLMPDERQR